LRQAAAFRPESRLYEEALDVLLVEHRGGERVYPKPGGREELPREWVRDKSRWVPRPFSLTRDGKLILLPGLLLQLDTGTTTRLDGPSARETSCDPTGTLLARRSESKGVEVVERATGKLRVRIDFPPPATSVGWRFSPNGRLLAVVQGVAGPDSGLPADRAIDLLDLSTGLRAQRIELPASERLRALPEFSGDSRFLAWIGSSEVRVYTVATGELTSRIPAPEVRTAGLSPDGTTLAWSTAGLSPDDTTLAWSTDRNVNVVQVSSGEPIRQLRYAEDLAICQFAYTPDGRFVLGQTIVRQSLVPGGISDRTCIWDVADGKLVAWLRGSAFAEGFGPRGELAVARIRGSGAEADLEIELWRPAELLESLEEKGLTGWVHFSEPGSPGGYPRIIWFFGIVMAWNLLTVGWEAAIEQRIQKKRLTVHLAYTGIVVTLLGIAIGVLCLTLAVTEFAGHWEKRVWLEHFLSVVCCADWGVVTLLYARVTGSRAVNCYTHVTYGEALPDFEQVQEISEEDRRRNRELLQIGMRWVVGLGILFAVVGYLHGSRIVGLLGWFAGPPGLILVLQASRLLWVVLVQNRRMSARLRHKGEPRTTRSR
jgi:hypothetical protein